MCTDTLRAVESIAESSTYVLGPHRTNFTLCVCVCDRQTKTRIRERRCKRGRGEEGGRQHTKKTYASHSV